MVDNSRKSEQEKLRTKSRWSTIMIVVCLMFGVALALGGAFGIVFSLDVQSDEYLTDKGILFRDMDNATYTVPVDDLKDLRWQASTALIMGAFLVLAGELLIFVTPSEIRLHKAHCDGTGEVKYCSECGLKLSRLERKG